MSAQEDKDYVVSQGTQGGAEKLRKAMAAVDKQDESKAIQPAMTEPGIDSGGIVTPSGLKKILRKLEEEGATRAQNCKNLDYKIHLLQAERDKEFQAGVVATHKGRAIRAAIRAMEDNGIS